MEFPWGNVDNIDPQLLMQSDELAQMGAFTQGVADSTEQPFEQEGDMNMEIDAQPGGMNLHTGIADLDIGHGLDIQMEQIYEPATPQRPLHSQQAFNPQAQNFYPTPPSSHQAIGTGQYPLPSQHNHNRFAVLSEGGSEPGALHEPYPYIDNAGFLTPNSAARGHADAAYHHDMTGSPTPTMTTRLPTSQRLYSQAAQAVPAMNMNGVLAGVPAVENMHNWVMGASSSSATGRTHGQSRLPQGGRVRAASVASSVGHGDFVCEGGPGKPCGKRFLTKSKMTHHARCHKEARKFCTLCNAGFYYEKDLKRHMKTHEPRDIHLVCNNIGCPYRKKPFARKDHLDRHSRSCQHSQA
ncbi:hypothetical protein CBER1_02217 [Cercospora berteroae]|uniref:C2H2-type domain-containing protein n=1 Tax=Cercospora berteroae TaxID=357750 RepID=A0A2S6BQ65_9PEZI|nr:hypothetical protein CBER1_02217 [Cercospora berteroae]